MASKKSSVTQRKTALGYIRQSVTRTPSDMDSPQRQKDNIERFCKAKGWTPEFYTDADGHKSGTKVANRPGWIALEERLNDPDVVAVVANDLARLHRKNWRIGQLVDMLEQRGIFLVLTAPGREIDLSNPKDRILIQVIGMIDEWYAVDSRLRLMDSVRYRHRNNVTIGMPPFGTWRDEDGFLVPSPNGAWLLPDGSFIPGRAGDTPPHDQALWRGYFECAEQILLSYAKNKSGAQQIAVDLNAEGWAFRTRNNEPRPLDKGDIRRVISNWREYAGLVEGGRAKDKNPARLDNPVGVLKATGRNVFPLELLQAVAEVHRERSFTTNTVSPKKESDDYALTGVLYCAQCAQDAREKNNPKLKVTLTGHRSHSTVPRYRHKEGYPCRAKNRSVKRDELERDFGRLLSLLKVNESKVSLLMELRTLSSRQDIRDQDNPDQEAERTVAVAKCRRRMENAKSLCLAGEITTEEYLRIKEQNEREIAHWEASSSEAEQAALELALCVDTIDRLSRLWEVVSGEDKQGMVKMLFEYIEYDLDTHRITDFRLKPWADTFLILRSALYETQRNDQNQEGKEATNTGSEPLSDTTLFCPWRGSEPPEYPPVVLLDPRSCASKLLQHIYAILAVSPFRNKDTRNAEIYHRYLLGQSETELAKAYALSVYRIRWIIQHLRRKK